MFLVGLVVILALMFGVVNMVLRANDGPSLSGDYNQVDPTTQLVGATPGDQALALEPLARRRTPMQGDAGLRPRLTCWYHRSRSL